MLSPDVENILELQKKRTIREEQLQTFVNDSPVNFKTGQKIDKTQDLSPAKIVSWNFCFWKTKNFLSTFEKEGFGVFNGKIGLYPIDKIRGVKISTESDFLISEALLKVRDYKTEWCKNQL